MERPTQAGAQLQRQPCCARKRRGAGGLVQQRAQGARTDRDAGQDPQQRRVHDLRQRACASLTCAGSLNRLYLMLASGWPDLQRGSDLQRGFVWMVVVTSQQACCHPSISSMAAECCYGSSLPRCLPREAPVA